MSESVDLSHIYKSRSDFTVIGLTGRSSSGCSQVAGQLAKGFDFADFIDPFRFGSSHNSYRKYRIIYDYAKVNFKPYTLIKYRHVLTLFLLQYSFDELITFLQSNNLKKEFNDSKFERKPAFTTEVELLRSIRSEFDKLSTTYKEIDTSKLKENNNWQNFYSFFFESSFLEFSNKFSDILKQESLLKRNKTLQVIANNLRKSGHPYQSDSFLLAKNVDTIVKLINDLIKSHRKKFDRTQIVIDSLRNPIEILFFKQRYSAFYAIAINREDDRRNNSLITKYTMDRNDLEKLQKEEYKGGEDSEFFKQKIESCIQQADIHINFLEDDETIKKNEARKSVNGNSSSNSSPFFTWRMQLIKYVSLISHPGLVTPSPEERCMQLAYTAKHNSGCISRHVGAAITDENYSIKAIGWNNTPEGQVPCVLRNAEDLLSNENDMEAFTPYEKRGEFKSHLADNYESQIEANRDRLQGRTVCFCFKCLKNSFSEGKNQVHTRSLHAEESAFLQLTKYGGMGIQGGKLFTTASPCELCAKKAYQLGIKEIYYIDPYPGISKQQILEAGANPIEVQLFNGAIGNAYHWLYDPIMPYKDELTLLLGNEIKDLTSKYKIENEEQREKIAVLEAKIQELEKHS